ncbi:unnamed protein product [marine sediment metagenome]|uniref:SpoVT-AbrB domain-containing protein n=1 Tax=marine sediment metagenome TaxID=412755 RepID=X1LIS5_9ZZZZ
MKYIKKVWKSGNSVVITLDAPLLKGKGIEKGDTIEIEMKIVSIKKLQKPINPKK